MLQTTGRSRLKDKISILRNVIPSTCQKSPLEIHSRDTTVVSPSIICHTVIGYDNGVTYNTIQYFSNAIDYNLKLYFKLLNYRQKHINLFFRTFSIINSMSILNYVYMFYRNNAQNYFFFFSHIDSIILFTMRVWYFWDRVTWR